MALNNYIEDDWDDNSLANRSANERGVFYNRYASGTGDLLKGVYRPQWTQRQTSGASASNGYLNIPSSDTGNVGTPSNLTVGSWTWTIEYPSTSSAGGTSFFFMVIDLDLGANVPTFPTDGYALSHNDQSTNSFDLIITEGGSYSVVLYSSQSYSTNTLYDCEVTRDSYGNFETFFDGVSQGTATNTVHQTAEQLSFANDGDCTVNYHNITAQ